MSHFVRILLAAGTLAAQSQTRGIIPEEVVQARPAAAAGSAAPAARPKYQNVAVAAGSAVATPVKPAPGRQIGVTIWRLRAATPADAGARILVQEDAQTAEWIPERVSSTSRLKHGDKVRLSIESPEAGYLYVIDREQYANGNRGEPYLIFPTTRTNAGNNEVFAGKLIDIPAQDDRPNFFSLRRSRLDQSGEELMILLTPAPLENIEIGPKALLLTEAQVAEWEKRWGTAKPGVFELSGGAGQPWSRAEQLAAAGRTRALTQDDPPPQTVYRVVVKPGEPLLVKLRLRL